MDIEELKQERKKAEDEIHKFIQPILENFVRTTGLPIENVFVNLSFDSEEFEGHKIFNIESVRCDVSW